MAGPNVDFRISGDDKLLRRALQRSEKEVDKLKGKLREIGQAGKWAGKGIGDAFDPRKLARFAGGLVGVGSIAAGLHTVIGLFDDMKQRSRGAAEGIAESEANMKRLIQISEGDPKNLAKLLESADVLGRQFGIARPVALGQTFQAASLQFAEAEKETFGSFKAFTADVAPLVEAVGGIRGAFGREAGGGTVRSVVNALLAGAAPSKVGVEEIASQILMPAQEVKKLGGTFEETLAGLGIIAVALKSIEQASTSIAAFARAAEKDKRLRGLGLLGSVEALAEMPEARRRKIITEARAGKAYSLIRENLEAIRETEADVYAAIEATGTEASRIQGAIRVAAAYPEIAALTGAQRARAGRALAEERELGVPELQIQTIQDLLRETLVVRGKGTIAQGLSLKFAEQAARFSRMPETVLDIATQILRQNFPIEYAMPSRVSPYGPITTSPWAMEREQESRAEQEAIITDFREVARELLDSAIAVKTAANNLKQSTGTATTLANPDQEPP